MQRTARERASARERKQQSAKWGYVLRAPLYRKRCNAGKVVAEILETKALRDFATALTGEEREWLKQAAEDPDTLFARERLPLLRKLVEANLAVDNMYDREPWLWTDQPRLKGIWKSGSVRGVASKNR
jgi:hypothetical protein